MRGCASLIVTLLAALPVMACPICDSETGQQVRASILDEDFARHLLLTILPFLVLLGGVALIHFGFPWAHRVPRSPRGVEDNTWQADRTADP